MLVLFETPAGYAIFKLLDEQKLRKSEDLFKDFVSPETASKVVKLQHFEKFADTTEALAATTAAVEGKLPKSLKKVLKKYVNKEIQDQLLVADAKLGSAIKDKLSLQCVSNTSVQELMRCIRSQVDGLLGSFPKKEMTAMALGLAHSLSRYKLKFSPDKVDTMIIQAVCLLDDLDKELNNYIMRTREWYGWHFPELGKIVTDNLVFVKTIKTLGMRENAATTDLSEVLPEDLEEKVKEAAEISMGTEISEDDITNIFNLCDQVIDFTNYRAQLYDYLTKRMIVIAPNLTTLVGELVGARLISHAGSLINLAKHPASTVQILGAEKALFRALKTKKDTPKFGLIYHSQLIGQASTIHKGKMARMLAAKASLAIRYDALGEEGTDCTFGANHRATLQARLRILEEGNLRRLSGTGKAKAKFEKYHSKSAIVQYPAAADSTLPSGKRKFSETFSNDETRVKIEEIGENSGMPQKKKKKIKHEQQEDGENSGMTMEMDSESPKKKNKKKKHVDEDKTEPEDTITEEPTSEKKKKKKKRNLSESADASEIKTEPEDSFVAEQSGEKKKKKKKKLSESMDASEIKTEPEESFVQSEEPSSEKKKKKKSKKHAENQ